MAITSRFAFTTRIALAMLLSLWALAQFPSAAHAQLGGTIWLDFVPNNLPAGYPNTATIGAETSFANALTGLPGLAGLTNAQVTQVETDTVNLVNAKYAGLSFNITSNAGDPNAANPSAPPGGNYTSVVIGAAAGGNANVLGQANQIDWRNLSFTDSIGVSVPAFGGFGAGNPFTVNANTDNVAIAFANTIAHEIGHTVGLVHDDAAATYATNGGTDAQNKTAVQNNDLMRANVTSFNSLISPTTSFNSYSQLKLQIATHGVGLENQAAVTGLGSPGAADPITRTADTNTTAATATPLKFDTAVQGGVVNVLGNMTGGNTNDYYSFSGTAGQTVDFEIYSLGLAQIDGDANSGRIPGGQSIGTSTLTLFDNPGGLAPPVVTSMFPTTTGGGTNYDGSTRANAYGDPLIYGYTLQRTGTFVLDVTGSQNGQYELLAVVPEPSSIGLIVLGVSVALLHRRRVVRPGVS